MTRAAAIVLAAGAGSRLGGRCKASLRLPDGSTFVAAIVCAARAAGVARVLVVAGAPHLAETAAAARDAGVAAADVLENPEPARGMASSLAVGLAALDPADFDTALSWPVDHPRVDPVTVAALVARAARGAVVVPRLGARGGHPTAFGADLWAELAAAAHLPGGARTVVAADPARVIRVAVTDPGVILDVDTPADHVGLA